MESATPTLLIVVFYLLFVKVLGPARMENRKPFDLRTPMILYNSAMAVYSAWMFYKSGIHGWFGKYSYSCEPVNYSEDEDSMGMVQACWHYSVSRLVELLDTVFFVLRKKDKQVPCHHVVHHAMTPLLVRYGVSHGAEIDFCHGGYNTLFGFANTFVHFWMYLYYALAALGPSVQKYLMMQWKKYLITLQMLQYVFMLIALLNLALNPACDTNWVLIMNQLIPAFIFLVLNVNFYRIAFLKKRQQRPVEKQQLSEEKPTQAIGSSTGLKQRPHGAPADSISSN